MRVDLQLKNLDGSPLVHVPPTPPPAPPKPPLPPWELERAKRAAAGHRAFEAEYRKKAKDAEAAAELHEAVSVSDPGYDDARVLAAAARTSVIGNEAIADAHAEAAKTHEAEK